ncbi:MULTISPECIES: AlpA family phage regulatory protein [unclassified Bradyrhizobium]|uniref:helix-turn-helix transcriptional regulator n=1 Tax=unclassified Bradyrhizobium TaxID=2631580 RepID=UPI003390A0AB
MSEPATQNKPVSHFTTEAPRPQAEDAAPEKLGLRRMLNIEQVLQIVPVSSVTIWRMEKKGLFPKGTFITPNTKIWWFDEIVAWQREVDGRRRSRRKKPKPRGAQLKSTDT